MNAILFIKKLILIKSLKVKPPKVYLDDDLQPLSLPVLM